MGLRQLRGTPHRRPKHQRGRRSRPGRGLRHHHLHQHPHKQKEEEEEGTKFHLRYRPLVLSSGHQRHRSNKGSHCQISPGVHSQEAIQLQKR